MKAVAHTVTVPDPTSTAEAPKTMETTEYRNEKVGSFFIQVAPLVVTDINLMPYSGFNPYVGIGIGPGFGYERDKGERHGTWTQALVISPRAGVELFERLRMFIQLQGYLSGGSTYSHVSFGLGWSFPEMMGMGPRR